ncbi:MAG: fluoride efflux transporter CrcB [Ferruginibacter sp.]
MLKNLLLAGLGGAIGTMIRFGLNLWIKTPGFPVATLLINIVGSLVIGIVFGLVIKDINFENNWKIFLATGICGGFTTFSAFSLENFQMLQQGKYFLSALYIITSIMAGIIAAWAGYKISAN